MIVNDCDPRSSARLEQRLRATDTQPRRGVDQCIAYDDKPAYWHARMGMLRERGQPRASRMRVLVGSEKDAVLRRIAAAGHRRRYDRGSLHVR